MAGKEIAVKKYVVRLDAEERDRLDELIGKGKRSAQLLTKARIDVSDAAPLRSPGSRGCPLGWSMRHCSTAPTSAMKKSSTRLRLMF